MARKKISSQSADSTTQALPDADYTNPQSLEALLPQVLKQANRPLGMDELLRVTRLPRKAKKGIEKALYSLQDQGLVVRAGGGWTAQAKLKHVRGTLSVTNSGVGFVAPEHGEGPDIYIHPAAMGDAWPGDSVEVLVLPGRRGPSREGRVTHVLARGLAELPAHAIRRQKNGLWLCAPVNPRIQALFVTDVSGLDKPVEEGNLILLRPGGKSGPNLWQATATANLEHEESPLAQERITKSNHNIPGPFPAAVLDAVRDLPQDPGEADFADRKDLRDLALVTIDGRTAKDFDDAIHVEALADGGYRLVVAIADVAHYVGQGGALDREAAQRGNSCYFPLSVEPMLPEALSNGLCSLKPMVPRLAMIAEMLFSRTGDRKKATFYPAVIQSKARLTYGQIQRAVLLNEAEEQARLEAHLPMLRQAESLARMLLERRKERGSLDFDLPEAVYAFTDDGALESIKAGQRHFGHQIIEECMIAANEAVADFLENKGAPALYRVHQPPDPDKLAALVDFLTRTGLELASSAASGPAGQPDHPRRAGGKTGRRAAKQKPPTAKELQGILRQVKGSPSEYVVTRLVLRSMMQARYQTDNEGHFGLASPCYCHFTSPIRRYADLTIHRSLKRALGLDRGGERPLSEARLAGIAEHINATERTAVEAEREMHKRLSALYLKDRAGEVFEGVISGLTDFGIFIELPGVMAEGMLRLSSLNDDYYEYLEERQELRGRRSGRIFRLGQNLPVRLTDVQVSRLEINLGLVEPDSAPGHTEAEAASVREPRRPSVFGQRQPGSKGRTSAGAATRTTKRSGRGETGQDDRKAARKRPPTRGRGPAAGKGPAKGNASARRKKSG